MPYCLACGKLRDLKGGLCWQCRNDMSLRKRNEARRDKAKAMRNIARDKRAGMPRPNERKANGHRWRQLRKRVMSWGDPCALCGKPIDYSLTTYVDPKDGKRKPHPWRFEVDHIVPVAKGGDMYDPSNAQAAHRICNQRKGDGTRKRKPPPPREDGLPNSGAW